jgi:hypothetical protein
MRFLRGKILQNYKKVFDQLFKKCHRPRAKNPYVQSGQCYCWYNPKNTKYFTSKSDE